MTGLPLSPADSFAQLKAFRTQYADSPPEEALEALDAVLVNTCTHPDWQAESARLLRLTGQHERARERVSELAARARPPALAAIEFARASIKLGHDEDALTTLARARLAQPDHGRLLAEYLIALKAAKGAEVAEAEAISLVIDAGVSLDGRAAVDITESLIRQGFPELAVAVLQAQTDSQSATQPLVHFARASAAQAVGDGMAARQHLSEGVLALTPKTLFNPVAAAMAALVLPDAHPTTMDQIIARLRAGDTNSVSAVRRVAKNAGDIEALIALIAPEGELSHRTGADLLQLLYALHDLGRYDEMRDYLASDATLRSLTDWELLAVLQLTSCLGDPVLSARLSDFALSRAADTMTSPKTLRLRIARLAGGAATSEAAEIAETLLALDSDGRLSRNMMYFLALNGEGLASLLPTGHALHPLLAKLPQQLQTLADVTPVLRERRAARLLLRGLGPAPQGKASVLIPMHRADDLANVRANLTRQTWPEIEAIVMPNGALSGTGEAEAALGDLPYVTILNVTPGTIGHYLNQGIEAATGRWVLRFDSDDTYLPDYIANTLALLEASDADMIFKPGIFVHIRALDLVVLQSEGEAFSIAASGNGGTQAFRAQALQKVRYDDRRVRSEDSQITRELLAAGGRIIAAPPFDFVLTRHADKSRHTWHLGDYSLYGERSFVGDGSVIPALGMPVFHPEREAGA